MALKPQPTGALEQMLAEDGEADRIMERGLTFAPAAPPPPPPAEPLYIPPYDGSSFVEPVRAVAPPLVEEDEQPAPAKPTPRLNTIQRWQREQLRADHGSAA